MDHLVLGMTTRVPKQEKRLRFVEVYPGFFYVDVSTLMTHQNQPVLEPPAQVKIIYAMLAIRYVVYAYEENLTFVLELVLVPVRFHINRYIENNIRHA